MNMDDTSTAGKCPVAHGLGSDYDHYDPAFAANPHPVYKELRASCPVAHSDNYGGFYIMTKFDDISEVLHDGAAFSSWPADTPATPGHTRPLIPLEVDAPDHRRYRMLVDPMFRPKAIEHIGDEVRALAIDLVEAMRTRDSFDFMQEFAQPFPSSVFLRLVGLDITVAQRDQLCEWAGLILHTHTANDDPGGMEARQAVRLAAGKELHNFIKELVRERTEHPGTDIISTLLASEMVDGRRLTHPELLNFIYVLILAGLDTVTTAIGFGIYHLAQRPDLQARLAADPSLIPGAIEELLRYEPIVHASRTVTEPRTIRGVDLKPGDRVVVPLASAHRDEDVFDHPDEIIIDRHVERTMVFGAGSHRCLGSHLARLELKIAYEEILSRMPQFELQPGTEISVFGGQTRSLMSLPIQLIAADRRVESVA